jgi:hypothetical protein
MSVVFLVAVFLTIARYAADPWRLASILTFALLLLFVASCVMLHQTHWIAIDTENVPIDPEGPGLPREVSEHYRHAVAGLTPLGFKPLLSYSKTKLVPNAIGFSTVLKNDRTGDVATIVNSFGSLGIKTSILVFRTEFADETIVTTSNNNFPSPYPAPRPPVHVFTIPQVQDPGRLYRVHQAFVGQFDKGGMRRDPIGDDTAAYLKRSQQRENARFVACGYQYLDEARRVQRLTWKGVILGTLKMIWPVRQIRNVWRRWKAARLLHELNPAGAD